MLVMVMDNLQLQRFIVRNRESLRTVEFSPRALELPTDLKLMVTLAGVRRCGKTSLLRHTAKGLITSGIPVEQVVYMNFEDERLSPDMTASHLMRALMALNPHLLMKDYYLFLDEVQAVEGWEKMLYTLHETEGARLFVTGSNADLLSKEIATALRGRSMTFELFPMSFKEYLDFKRAEANLLREESRAETANMFDDYMRYGGFPDVCSLENNQMKVRVLQEYFNSMLYRDLIERYNISSPVTLKYFCKRIVENIGKPTSVNKIFNELKSQGRKLTKDTLYEWLDHVENVFLFQRCPKPVQSLVKQSTGYDKFYGIDSGLMAALSANIGSHSGRLLENVIFIQLRMRGHHVAYHFGKKECDFLIFEEGEVKAAVQVSLQVTEPDTLKREVDGLLDACQTYGLKRGTVVTLHDEHRFEKDGVEIDVVPAFEYVLKESYL
jgi:uncharacterized protein